MSAKNKRAILDAMEFEADGVVLDDLEQNLQMELDLKLEDLNFLMQEREHINNPDHLGETVLNVIWEQVMTQIPAVAADDFIEANGGLTLDLRNEAHILTVENFEQGKMPTHNSKEKYQQRYREYRDDFQTDPDAEVKMSSNMRYNEETKTYERYDKGKGSWVGKTRYNEETKVWEDWDSRSGSWKKKLAADARDKFDTRTAAQKGSASVAKDHTISAAEQIRDTEAAAYVDRETRQNFAKSDVNLNDLDARANSSKNDSTMEEWLNSERDGKKPSERFDIDEDDLRKKDVQARKEYEKMKAEGKKDTIDEGRKSQREEAFRIGGQALRMAFMTLLASLLKEIVGKLVQWFKSAEKSLNTLIQYIKIAIIAFVAKLKNLLVSTTESVLTMIVTSIVGPVVGTIKKTVALLRQGWNSLKEAIKFLGAPENRGKPLSYLLPEVGKIVIAGLSGIGAVVLGEFIEKALMGIPFLAVDIPLLGSPANLIGMLMGAIVCGVIGAIAINLINKYIAKQQKNDNLGAQIDKKNEILAVQDKLLGVKGEKLDATQQEAIQNITDRHKVTGVQLGEILESVLDPAVSEAQDLCNEELDRMLQGL